MKAEPLLSHCINQVLRAASGPLTLRQITIRVNRMLPKAQRVTVQQVKAVIDPAASNQ